MVRSRIALLMLAVIFCGWRAPDLHAKGLAFVVNSNSASISVIDMSDRKELRRVPTLREPHHLVLSPDGQNLLVGDTAGNEVLALDPSTGDVRRRLPVADPYQLGLVRTGKFLVVKRSRAQSRSTSTNQTQ